MEKFASTRLVKSRAASSSSHSPGAKKPSASSRSAKQMRAKRGATVSISEHEGRASIIGWTKVDAAGEAEIERQAREDGTRPPSERAWRRMAKEGRIRVVPPAQVDVRAIRKRMKLSQSEFAARFGFTASAVRQWEQGRRRPEGAARAFLKVIEREPAAVQRALAR
jgi:putative transcriptional regulator